MTRFRFQMIVVALFVTACSTNQGFEGYRYNPFQYPYPEYDLKAKLIPISNEKIKSENNMVNLEFFGLKSYVPDELFKAEQKEAKENKIIYKDGDKFLIIIREKENLLGCVDEQVKYMNKDFCSAFDSTKDYYDKLYSLTPEDLKRCNNSMTGNKWIVHRKGFTFENVDTLNKYIGKDFIAFESCYKSGSKMTKDLILFLDKTQPYYFTFATNVSDDLLFRRLLESLQ